MVSFHALRHTHASALIAAGLDVVVISRRLGHASPNITLRICGHLFKRDDSAAARAIEVAMRTRSEPSTQ
jgi:integrase